MARLASICAVLALLAACLPEPVAPPCRFVGSYAGGLSKPEAGSGCSWFAIAPVEITRVSPLRETSGELLAADDVYDLAGPVDVPCRGAVHEGTCEMTVTCGTAGAEQARGTWTFSETGFAGTVTFEESACRVTVQVAETRE